VAVKPLAIIVAVSSNGVIGKDGGLPWPNIPEDMAHFRRVTEGRHIIMGRKTFESIGRPLPKRVNIVISRTLNENDGRAWIVKRSLVDALHEAYRGDVCPIVIGGAEIYREALPLATVVHLTHVRGAFDGDVHWPKYNRDEWDCGEVRKLCDAADVWTFRRSVP
jgi:dihydrofolate reductase